MPCYRIDRVLPASTAVVDILDKQRGYDDVDGADRVAEHVQKDAAHCQSFVQVYTTSHADKQVTNVNKIQGRCLYVGLFKVFIEYPLNLGFGCISVFFVI